MVIFLRVLALFFLFFFDVPSSLVSMLVEGPVTSSLTRAFFILVLSIGITLGALRALSLSLYPWLPGGSHLLLFHQLLQAMVKLQLLPVVDALRFVATQLVVVVVGQGLGVYPLVESLVFLVLFPIHSQSIFLDGGKNTYHVHPPQSSSKCALAFLLEAFAQVVLLAFSLHCRAGVVLLDLAPG